MLESQLGHSALEHIAAVDDASGQIVGWVSLHTACESEVRERDAHATAPETAAKRELSKAEFGAPIASLAMVQSDTRAWVATRTRSHRHILCKTLFILPEF